MKNLHKISPTIPEVALAVIWYATSSYQIAKKFTLHDKYGAMFWSESLGLWDHWNTQMEGMGLHEFWVEKGRPQPIGEYKLVPYNGEPIA